MLALNSSDRQASHALHVLLEATCEGFAGRCRTTAAVTQHRQAENVHALKGLACRARVAPASSSATPASRVRRSRRLRSTLAAAPGLLAHALVTNHETLTKYSDAMSYSVRGTHSCTQNNDWRYRKCGTWQREHASFRKARPSHDPTQTSYFGEIASLAAH